jgi:3D (Asp-Asp-Asp) domain-containing protein
MEVTGYCPCRRCCGWTYNWRGQPVYASGPLKGKPKVVGLCADGTMAGPGTVAADTSFYPFGTRIYVPGYGPGTVHDKGQAIRGAYRLDLFFRTHEEARRWGRRRVMVLILPR